jgi:hypothetical protein
MFVRSTLTRNREPNRASFKRERRSPSLLLLLRSHTDRDHLLPHAHDDKAEGLEQAHRRGPDHGDLPLRRDPVPPRLLLPLRLLLLGALRDLPRARHQRPSALHELRQPPCPARRGRVRYVRARPTRSMQQQNAGFASATNAGDFRAQVRTHAARPWAPCAPSSTSARP